MRIRTLVYYITTGFVIGIIMLVSAQYITSTNVRELISGNENLLKEYKVNSELVGLQKDLLLLDNKIKTAVTTGDSSRIKDFEAGVLKIKEDVNQLKKTGSGITSTTYINELDNLVDKKINFSQQMVDSFFKAGKPAIESQIASNQAIKLSEEITNLTHKIDTSGRIELAQKIKSVDQSGQKVLSWNLYIIVLVLFLLTAVFLIIINRMKKQADLINQLNTSEKKLKEAALIKENFLANMSHEIRTPLNAILGYTHLLQRKKLDDDARLHVATVQQSGETLLSIVNDILDLSKIESGMMRIEQIPFSLSGLIHSLTAMFHHKIEEKKLVFQTSISSEIPDILVGDATRLTQILVNLIGNAIKFTNDGKITLVIQEKSTTSDQITIEFNVTDTGIGIEEEKLETIFERFRQAEDSTTRKYGGTGLGLSIVKDLVYLQDGNIELKSEFGFGTIVKFSIPYKIATHQNQLIHSKIDSSNSGFKKNIKILVVEDNVINQGLMSHFLDEFSVKNTIASNGKEALEILKHDSYDLIFMDIQMPEMDGYTAAQEIRQTLKLNIPIVAMTAHAMAGEREKCISFGMNEHISKPIRESDLQHIISQFTGNYVSPKSNVDLAVLEGNDYKIIDLRYMKEISKGDEEYEKLVTEQFLKLVPEELTALTQAFENKQFIELKQIAHNMKTSISIMGLDSLLNPHLDIIEHENLSDEEMGKEIDKVISVCQEALVEGGQFHSRFN